MYSKSILKVIYMELIILLQLPIQNLIFTKKMIFHCRVNIYLQLHVFITKAYRLSN